MAGAGARTRKSGAPSAKVGSVEVLRPRQIGPTIPTMRELGGMYAAAAGARGAERRTLEARAESGRQARAALLTARGGEKRALAAAEAGAPRLNMANALGVTAEQHYGALSSQRANWYAERMKATDPIKRARITGLIKQYDAAMPGAHAAMMAEAAAKAAKPQKPGLEHFVAQRAAAKAREAEAARGANPFHEAGLKGPMRETSGPHDHEGAGRSRYWDTPTAQRAAMMPAMVKQAGQPFTPEQDRRFAKGWLDEHDRVKQAAAKLAPATQKAPDVQAPKPARPAATSVKLDERNAFTKGKTYGVTHVPTGKGVPYVAGMLSKEKAERAAAGTKSGRTIDRLINGTQEQKMRASEALRRYAVQVHGLGHDTERHDYHRALAARKTKAAEAERMAKAEARRERRAAKPSVPEATAGKARALGATSIRGGKVAFHPNAWERHNEFKTHLEKEGVPFRVKHTGTFVLG